MKLVLLISCAMILLLSLTLLPGCSHDLPQEQSKEHVVLKLKWVHQAQFTGNYVAKEKGFYAQNGLDVEILPFSFEDPTIEAVVQGKAQFGITGADELLLAREKGLPLVAIAVIYRINPACVYFFKDKNITAPKDLAGKRVGIERNSNVEISYNAMMARMHIDRNLVTEITTGYDAAELLANQTDASTGYLINEPYQAIEQGYQIGTLLMSDYGAIHYADVIFTTEDLIRKDPSLVKRFLDATLDGWDFAFESGDEAIDIVLKYAVDRTRSHEAYMLKTSVPLIYDGVHPLGWMTRERWEEVENILLDLGMMKQRIDVNDAYDNSFIKQIVDNGSDSGRYPSLLGD